MSKASWVAAAEQANIWSLDASTAHLLCNENSNCCCSTDENIVDKSFIKLKEEFTKNKHVIDYSS